MSDNLDLRILSCLLQDSATCRQFAQSYDSSLFSDEYRRFAKLTLDYTKTFRSPPTERTLKEHQKNNAASVALIDKIWPKVESANSNVKEFSYDLKQLKLRYQKNKRRTILANADNSSTDDPESFFKNLALQLQDIARLDLSRTYTHKTAGEHIEAFKESYSARRDYPESNITIKTRYSAIDECCKGISPAELIMIGGETNAGKSMFMKNIAVQLWLQENEPIKQDNYKKGNNILYFSLEMPYEDCFNRFLACVADIPQFGITDPNNEPLTEDQNLRMEQALEFIDDYEKNGCFFDIVDTPRECTIEEIELRFNDALLKYRPDVIVVDYMGLMHNPHFAKEADWLRMGAIAASLHEFARAYDVCVVTAAQLTDIKRNAKGKIDEDKRVGPHRWGRSSLIMHHVNLGIQIESRPGERDYPDFRYHIVKNRKGPLAVGTCIKNFANAKLIDVEMEQKNAGDLTEQVSDLKEKIRQAKENENNEQQS